MLYRSIIVIKVKITKTFVKGFNFNSNFTCSDHNYIPIDSKWFIC